MRSPRLLAAAAVLVALDAAPASAQEQKSVLTLWGGRVDLPVNAVMSQTIRTRLHRKFGPDVDFRFESVEPSADGAGDEALRDFLLRKYAGHRFDLLIAITSRAADFARTHGRELFPGVPVVCWGSPEMLESWERSAQVAAVLTTSDPGATVELILGLQPATRRLVVVSGDSRFDDPQLLARTREALRAYEGRLAVTQLSGLTLEALREEVARLGERTAILYLTMSGDATGRRYVNVEALQSIVETARAPIYSVSESYMEAGIVGGVLISQRRGAEEIAEMAVRILNGERASALPVVESRPVPMVDWRQLRRWGIPEARLPPGTVVLQKQPSLWEAYRWHVVGVVSLCVVQAVLIGGLLMQRAQRRRAAAELRRTESVAREQRHELAHLSRVAVLGELSGTLAHELNQPLAAILANAQAAQQLLAATPPESTRAHEALDGIVEADLRARDIIQRLRAMLKRGETPVQRVDLNEVAREALALADGDLRAREVGVLAELAPGLPAVAGDRIQLQQVLLNLILNGCDAMGHVPRGERRLRVATKALNGTVVLDVEDRGTGIPGSDIERIFEPFHSTKSQGLGLGLAICRTIVGSHGGRLWASNNPERGATLHLELPVSAERAT